MEEPRDRAQLGFLLTRRWVGLLAFAILFAITCLQLGRWQLHRLEQRHRANHLITNNASSRPAAAGEVLRVDRPLAHGREYARVRMTGTYDTAHQLLVRNRTLDGVVGYWVLVPLVPSTAPGRRAPALLVNRGWIAAGQSATRLPPVPAAPSGTVTVLGRVRPPESGDPHLSPATGEVTRIAPPAISRAARFSTYDGYLDLVAETPRPAAHPRLLPAPETSEGPHLSYAFQWFLFGLMALGGYVQLARRELSDRLAADAAPDRASARTSTPRPTTASPTSVVSVRVDT